MKEHVILTQQEQARLQVLNNLLAGYVTTEQAPASFLYPVRETPITTGKVDGDVRFQTVIGDRTFSALVRSANGSLFQHRQNPLEYASNRGSLQLA